MFKRVKVGVILSGVLSLCSTSVSAQAVLPGIRIAPEAVTPITVAPEIKIKGPDLCLLGGTVHDGDLTVASPADVPPLLRRVTGDLTVRAPFPQTISFPCLESVGGDLSVTLEAGADGPNPLQSRMAAPKLKTVGGNLDATMARATGYFIEWHLYELGLGSITTVGGDAAARSALNCAFVSGLEGLTTIPGQATIGAIGSAYFYQAGRLLPNLQSAYGVVLEGTVMDSLPAMVSTQVLTLKNRTVIEGHPVAWTDMPITALIVDDWSHFGGYFGDYVDLDPGAPLVVVPGGAPTLDRVCDFLTAESADGWSPVVYGIDVSSCP